MNRTRRIQGLVCNGHTGEITGLTRAERKRVVEICAEECGDIMTVSYVFVVIMTVSALSSSIPKLFASLGM